MKPNKNITTFRTLNYLGSKLRLLDFIENHIQRITPIGSGVCDLFAGSGCVSYRLSSQYKVTACDIQNYSAIICEALLRRHSISEDTIFSFKEDVLNSKNAILKNIFAPLIQLELNAIQGKDLETLTDIVEHGSLEVFRIDAPESPLSPLQQQVADALVKSQLMGCESLISRYYGGVYFSYTQAVQIDIILSAIRKVENRVNKKVFLAALLSTVSDVVGTVGKHFAQPIKARDSKGNIKPLVYNKAVKDKTIDIEQLFYEWLDKYISLSKSEYQHSIYQGDYMSCIETLSEEVRTIYADPPYTRDHYSRFYHVLETIALDDSPEISTVTIKGKTRVSNGIYRKDRHQSPFCVRSKAPNAFDDMFRAIAKARKNLLLSYSPYDESKASHPRVVTMEQLIALAKKHFLEVDVVSAGHFTHSKLNSSEHFLVSSDEAEVLIICRN